MTESGNNETLEIDYKSREGVRSRNEISEISDVLLKATWSDLKADTLNPRKTGPKGACSL